MSARFVIWNAQNTKTELFYASDDFGKLTNMCIYQIMLRIPKGNQSNYYNMCAKQIIIKRIRCANLLASTGSDDPEKDDQT